MDELPSLCLLYKNMVLCMVWYTAIVYCHSLLYYYCYIMKTHGAGRAYKFQDTWSSSTQGPSGPLFNPIKHIRIPINLSTAFCLTEET